MIYVFGLYLFYKVLYPMPSGIQCYSYLLKPQVGWCYSFLGFKSGFGSKQFYSTFKRNPVHFPKIGWTYMISRQQLQSKSHAFVLSNLRFSFQVVTQEKIPRCATIAKRWFYKSITKQSSGQIIQTAAVPPQKMQLCINIFTNSTGH